MKRIWKPGYQGERALRGASSPAPGRAPRGRAAFRARISAALPACMVTLLCLSVTGCSSLVAVQAPALARGLPAALAIVGASILSLDSPEGRVLPGMTVLIEGESITAVGRDGTIGLPPAAAILDASGAFLMAGLVDMHVHLSSEGDLPRLLRHGVTTVRNMADIPGWTRILGFPDVLCLRSGAREGRLLGPDILTAGLCLDGRPPVSPLNAVMKDPGEARKRVADEGRRGYDFVKVYDGLTPACFEAAVEAARARGVAVAGHVPKAVGLAAALDAGMLSIEHLTGYIDNDKAALLVAKEELPQWAARTKAAGVYNCPTLGIWEGLPPAGRLDLLEDDPEWPYVAGHLRWLWGNSLPYYYRVSWTPAESYTERMAALSSLVTKALHEAGADILVGSDTNIVGAYPGSATWRELELLGRAGLSNAEVLRAATINAARALGREGEFGAVEAGMRANLILLGANPLEDLTRIRSLRGTILAGRWLEAAELDAMADGYYRVGR